MQLKIPIEEARVIAGRPHGFLYSQNPITGKEIWFLSGVFASLFEIPARQGQKLEQEGFLPSQTQWTGF